MTRTKLDRERCRISPDNTFNRPIDSPPQPTDSSPEASNDAREGRDPPVEERTEAQRKTLQKIFEHPDASQAAIAEKFGVSSATVSIRANQIDGFDWKERQSFVNALFGNQTKQPNGTGNDVKPNHHHESYGEIEENISILVDQVGSLEQRLMERQQTASSNNSDAELASKMICACINADTITEREGLDIGKVVISITEAADS